MTSLQEHGEIVIPSDFFIFSTLQRVQLLFTRKIFLQRR